MSCDEPIICVWCHKPIEGTKQSQAAPSSGYAHEGSCDRLLHDHRRKHLDEQMSAADIVREYREDGPSGPCPDCEQLRSKVAELERGILGVLAHYKRFSTVLGSDVGKKAALTILLKMRDLGLCGQRDEEEPT